ncbi:MAG TPA: amino acid ABC transporter permease [Desulfonatronum sp.]|nr:amino acid ABC transporter permease [Desulfonatronum sp.]
MNAEAGVMALPRFARDHFRDLLLYGLLIGAAAWLISAGEQSLGYHWKWYRIPRYIIQVTEHGFVPGTLLLGLLVTFKISALSLVLALFFGLTTAVFRLSGSFTARLTAKGYVEFIRNTPLLTQIFFIYYVVGPIFGLGAFASAVLALSLFEGAYASEIFRAGIVSIHKGQWEASHSLGLSTWDTYRKVIIPQAVRRVLPPLTGVGVTLIKDSSLASTIAIYELTQQGNIVASDTFMVFEVWFTVAAVYLAVTLPLSLLAAKMGKRLQAKED